MSKMGEGIEVCESTLSIQIFRCTQYTFHDASQNRVNSQNCIPGEVQNQNICMTVKQYFIFSHNQQLGAAKFTFNSLSYRVRNAVIREVQWFLLHSL